MRPLFFTGTGTDIGKTHVLCEIIRAWRASGRSMRVLKPVISGFDPSALNETDTIRLMRANEDALTGEGVQAVSPWRFRAPLSPDLAARKERRELALDKIVSWCLDHISRDMPTVIEGAGGVMSPIASDGLNLDLIRELDAHPVLVAGSYLGTISHTLTALRVLDGRCSVILNDHPESDTPIAETARTISRFAPRADIRVFDPAAPAALLDLFERAAETLLD
ncbi:dethiobiotin synthase [Maricaulis maris]|jgi:dethiobiotin synthetase|uniref:dethiobiotin synthase n=1 Tax=Maricaulis maris TaxID=74318 RepID=UPI0026F284C0|nr:dethiobiotin synthase [Maricaulis maris]